MGLSFFTNHFCLLQKKSLSLINIWEKDDNLGYNLATHCDIEKISVFPNEREV